MSGDLKGNWEDGPPKF